MNRFVEMDQYLKRQGAKSRPPAARSMSLPPAAGGQRRRYARPMAASDRALVVLIENGGVDLGIPALVDYILSNIPGAGSIPDGWRAQLINHLQDKIKQATDALLETAELTVNRYSAAAPDYFNEVAILRDGSASYADLKNKLTDLSRAGKIIDLLILTHGSDDYISVAGGINGDKIRAMKTGYGKPLSIRSVYMMNCVGSSLNQAWLDAGAKVSCGAMKNNYLPEPTTYYFWKAWKNGKSFESAATDAYKSTIKLMNETVRGFVRTVGGLAAGLIADKIDFSGFQFVADSAPQVQGDGSVTISSDSLTFTQSLPDGMVTTVLPAAAAHALSASYSMAASAGSSVTISHSYSFRSPSVVTQMSEFSLQQNPGALLIAGMEVADAAQIGLAAAAMVQAQVSASQGSFTLTYDKAQRLLTTEARMKMPGSQTSKKTYSHRLLKLEIGRWNTAEAEVVIEWDGNAYGEIGTPVIRRNLSTSTEWSQSSAVVNITQVQRIPLPHTDPRAWPLVYVYEGTYDPMGNGYFEFSGEFEINAFGGLKFNKHEVKSRSLLDATLAGTPETKVRRGDDVTAAVPSIPQEQIEYLKSHLP